MKTIKFAVILLAAVSFTACSALQGTQTTTTSANNTNLFDAGSVINANSTAANAGSTAGAALKLLYSSYKQQGKLNMTDLNTIISVAQLVNSCQNLKNSDATYKKAFGTGLVLGSTGLVTNNNSMSVTSALASAITGVNTNAVSNLLTSASTNNNNNAATVSSLLGALATNAQNTTTGQQVTTTVNNTANKAANTAAEVSNISNSVVSILNLLGNN